MKRIHEETKKWLGGTFHVKTHKDDTFFHHVLSARKFNGRKVFEKIKVAVETKKIKIIRLL
jgi:hypothetical protein